MCVLVLLCIFPVLQCSAEDEIKVIINNEEVHCPNPPIIVNGRTLLPLRALGEAMGCKVVWIANGQYANLQNDTTLIGIQIGNKLISKQKRTDVTTSSVIETDVPAQIINGSTYIPVRAFAEAMDAVVGWDSNTRTVMIVYDTTVKYAGNFVVETYAGTGERQNHDSELERMSFVSPESLAVGSDGAVYVADSGRIRRLYNGKSETVELEPEYITANLIRCYKDDVYILTNEFRDSDGIKYYGIVRLNASGASGVFLTEANYSSISDFDISKDGKLYALYNNLGAGASYLGEIDLATQKINYLTELDQGIKTLAVDDNGNVFLGNTVKGSLYFYNVTTGEQKLFAGADGKIKFVDGPNPMFFEPRRMDYRDGSLYVLDYNLVRRISVDKANSAIAAETLAGKVSVEQNPDTVNGSGSEAVFAPSYLMDILATDDGVLLTDPKKSVIRLIHD